MQGRYLEHMTWTEAQAARADLDLALVPLGARTKEHGLHLPLSNDWHLAEYLTRRVVERCRVLALPTLQYGYYPAFVEYPGSVSLSRDTARAVVEDIARSLARHGWTRVYVLNTGVSTCWALEPARQALAADGVTLAYTDLLAALEPLCEGLVEQARGTHADEVETSMMLYIAPDLVRLERAERDDRPRLGPGPFTRDPQATTGVHSPTGAWGDPTLATRAKGERVVEGLVEHLVAEVEAFARPGWTPPPPVERYLG